MNRTRKLRSTWWLAIVLALGYLPVHVVVVGFASTWIESLAREVYSRQLIVRRSGEINIGRYEQGYSQMRYYALDGTPVHITPVSEIADPTSLLQPAPSASFAGSLPEYANSDSANDSVARLEGWQHPSRENWFIRRDHRDEDRACLEVYDFRSRGRIGFLSPRGLTETRPDPSDQWQLPDRSTSSLASCVDVVSYRNSAVQALRVEDGVVKDDRRIPTQYMFIAAVDGVWQVDLLARRATRIEEIKGALALQKLSLPAAPGDKSNVRSREHIVARTADTLVLLDPVEHTRNEVKIPGNMSRFGFSVWAIDDGDLIFQESLNRQGKYDPTFSRFVWVGRDGKVGKAIDTAPQPDSDSVFHNPTVAGIGLATAFPLPLAALVGWGGYWHWLSGLSAEVYERRVDPANTIMLGWFLVGTIVVSGLLAIVAVRRARQTGGAVPWQWGLFVLLLGLPGLVGLLYARRRPSLAQSEWLRGEPLAVPPKLSTDLFAA